jgi:hypothetical protein
VRHITLPNTDTPVFSVEQFRNKPPKDQLSLNADYMASFGTFSVPIKVWESLTRFSVWIEPVLVSEWINTMVSYEGNRVKNFTKLDFINALNWENPERSTARIRSKVLTLSAQQSLHCCWSGKKLKLDHYAIDHAFPFARWPNNDLWNLLPTDSKINANKADKLPSANRLGDAKDRILSWWEAAWINDPDEFFTQANLALPSILPKNRSYEEVFNALTIQRDRIKDFQQLQDW